MDASDTKKNISGWAWPEIARALRSRNYRLFFGGQLISLIGTWMTNTATMWLVYDRTNDERLLGLVGFAGQFPILLLAAVAGVIVDRHDRRRLLIGTQTLAMLQSGTLAFLALTGLIQIWHLFVLVAFQGFINSFDMPGRQAFVIEMVERPEDLSNAIALNSSMFNGARLLGPSIAGIVLAQVGAGSCFLIDAISYLAVIASLVAMTTRSRPATVRRVVTHELREGWSYVTGFHPVRAILLLLAIISLTGMSFIVLLPVFAKDILHGDARTLGFLMGAPGVGALIGALLLASRKSVIGLGRVIVLSGSLFGASLIAFSFSASLLFSLPLLALTGFGMMMMIASCNTILQTISDEDKRGRVMSYYTIALLGTSPLGSLLAGYLASWLDAQNAVRIGGSFSIAACLVFLRSLPRIRLLVRPIYARKGILPEVARGIQSATAYGTPPKE